MQTTSSNRVIQLSDEELAENFKAYDKDGSGYLTFDEIKHMYAKHKVSVNDKSLRALFLKYDKDKTGRMNMQEFKQFLEENGQCGQETSQSQIVSKLPEEELRKNFQMYDINGDGKVSFHEVWQVFTDFGIGFSEQMQDYFQKCDKGGDGSLSFEEFVTFVNGE